MCILLQYCCGVLNVCNVSGVHSHNLNNHSWICVCAHTVTLVTGAYCIMLHVHTMYYTCKLQAYQKVMFCYCTPLWVGVCGLVLITQFPFLLILRLADTLLKVILQQGVVCQHWFEVLGFVPGEGGRGHIKENCRWWVLESSRDSEYNLPCTQIYSNRLNSLNNVIIWFSEQFIEKIMCTTIFWWKKLMCLCVMFLNKKMYTVSNKCRYKHKTHLMSTWSSHLPL